MEQIKSRKPFFDRILDIFGGLAGLIIVFTMFAVLFEVFMRYFLNRPTFWVLEVVEWCMVWMTFFSAPYVLKENRHVSMDIVSSRLQPGAKIILSIVTSIIGALICIVLAFYGSRVVLDHISRGVVEAKMLRAPKGPLMAIIPFGFFLLSIQFLRQTVALWKNMKNQHAEG